MLNDDLYSPADDPGFEQLASVALRPYSDRTLWYVADRGCHVVRAGRG
eukprot:SAG31_NODE_3251_length_4490_cov_2.556821_2_plen_48_part_00